MKAEKPASAFAAIRPPGHHCGEDTPSGFCFVNNVAIGAAYGEAIHTRRLQLTNTPQPTYAME